MKTKMTKSEAVLLSLTKEEAVVLSDWLYRNSRKREYFADAAEQTVFWGIECMLEKVLSGGYRSGCSADSEERFAADRLRTPSFIPFND